MSEYFDTPMIVFASVNLGELGAAARAAIADCDPCSTPHAIAEAFNVLTYRLGHAPKRAIEALRPNLRRFEFIVMDAQDYQSALDRVLDCGLTGDKVYDALHICAAEKARCSKVHTSNSRDFSAFKSKIEIIRY